MTTITFDIETIGSEDVAVIAEIAAGITPPGNLSKADSIAIWEKDKKPGLIEEAVKKTSFDGGLGRIVCIGWAVDGNAPEHAIGAESDIIGRFYEAMQNAGNVHYKGGIGKTPPIFVGHNIAGFDLRFLWQRTVALGIKPPSLIPFKAKPWDSTIADTMIMWHPERDKRVRLDSLCKMLGIQSSKNAMDGSKVWDYFKSGRIGEIAEYCMADVVATRECYRRMAFVS